jgi:site-specific DNA recombinase
MKRIALYCRVSTDNQEKSETIENQLRDLYKVYNKADVVKVYMDNPGSGADPDRRGLWELRKDAQKRIFDTIGLWDSSRLARDLKLALILRDEFKELGIGIEIMGRERDDSDSGKLVSVLEATMDELERNRIKRRFISGRDRRLSDGKLIGCYPPLGYRHIRRNRENGIDAALEINESEAIIVRKIFDLYIKHESILMVAIQLKKDGIKGRGKGRSEPGFMQVSSVSKILRRETYIGNHYFGKTSPCIAKFHLSLVRKHTISGRRVNPKSEWKLVKVPRIIDDEKFFKTQEIMKKRAKQRIEMSKYQFLCQGLIRCVKCGRSYGGRSQNGYLFYRCPQCFTSNINQAPCNSRSMGRKKLDEAVWSFVSNFITNKDKINNAVIELRKKREKEKGSNEKLIVSLFAEKNILKVKRKGLFDLFLEPGFSDYAKNDLKAKVNELDEKEKQIENQISELKGELENIENTEEIENELNKFRKEYSNKIKSATFELKKYIVRRWVEEINIFQDGSVKIKVRMAKGEDRPKAITGVSNVGIKFEELVNP